MYRTAASEASKEWRRSLWALAVLGLTQIAWLAATRALGGTTGGFGLGIVESFLVGWYLSLLDVSVNRPRQIGLDDVQSRLGGLFLDTMSVLFAFWLPQFLLSRTAPTLLMVLVPVAGLAFNVVPELLYQGKSTSFALLRDSAKFMSENWPEWLGAHIPLWLVSYGAVWLAIRQWDADLATSVVGMFGPFFGFALSGPLAIGLMVGAPVLGIVGLGGVHWVMLFRGRLFLALSRTNRRGRAWSERAGSR